MADKMERENERLTSLDSKIQKINESLYISGQLSESQLQAVIKAPLASVLCLRCTQESGFRVEEKVQVEAHRLAYSHNPISAEALTYEVITQTLKEIDRLPKPTLISCRSAFRSGFIALLYISTRNRLTPRETQSLRQRLGFDFSAKPVFQQWFEQYLMQYPVG